MSSPQEAGMELAVKIDTSKPIRFSRHDFGAACYDTFGCRVAYAGKIRLEEPEGVKSASTTEIGSDYLDYLSAGDLAIGNFPPAAEVTWMASDQTPLSATVDFGEIFKDELVLHGVPKDRLPSFLYTPIVPGIILVVDNRTLRVYMKARIPTVALQDSVKDHSDFRDDMVLAYSRTY